MSELASVIPRQLRSVDYHQYASPEAQQELIGVAVESVLQSLVDGQILGRPLQYNPDLDFGEGAAADCVPLCFGWSVGNSYGGCYDLILHHFTGEEGELLPPYALFLCKRGNLEGNGSDKIDVYPRHYRASLATRRLGYSGPRGRLPRSLKLGDRGINLTEYTDVQKTFDPRFALIKWVDLMRVFFAEVDALNRAIAANGVRPLDPRPTHSQIPAHYPRRQTQTHFLHTLP